MTYISPFDKIIKNTNFRFSDLWDCMEFDDNFDYVIDMLQKSLLEKNKRIEDYQNIALNPPRLVRGLLEYKIGNELESFPFINIINRAMDLGLQVYSGHPNSVDLLNAFKAEVKETNPEILEKRIMQEPDHVTWNASHPRKSEISTRYILNYIDGRDILMIALAHGGIGPALDVFNMYKEMSQSTRSEIYPVRLSLDKKNDRTPRLNQLEIYYLIEQSKDREVVLFDEDISSGKTMKCAIEYFKDLLKKDLVVRANSWPSK